MKVFNLVLASGSGTRLYPLSTKEKPKQFLKLISDNMIILDTLERFKDLSDEQVVVTLEKYGHYIREQVEHIVFEKEKRETAYSVLAFLKAWENEFKTSDDDIVIQTASDHYVTKNTSFDETIKRAIELAKEGKISAIGAKPTSPDPDYGYIKTGHKLIEKPNISKAMQLIDEGYSWNTAIYVYRIQDMVNHYAYYFDGEPTSFERTILEHEDNIEVVSGDFTWHDLGSHERLDMLYSMKR